MQCIDDVNYCYRCSVVGVSKQICIAPLGHNFRGNVKVKNSQRQKYLLTLVQT